MGRRGEEGEGGRGAGCLGPGRGGMENKCTDMGLIRKILEQMKSSNAVKNGAKDTEKLE